MQEVCFSAAPMAVGRQLPFAPPPGQGLLSDAKVSGCTDLQADEDADHEHDYFDRRH